MTNLTLFNRVRRFCHRNPQVLQIAIVVLTVLAMSVAIGFLFSLRRAGVA